MIEQLYNCFSEELLAWCTAMTRDKYMAEDLVQETFFRAMKNLSLLEDLSQKQCRSWLYRTAKNVYVDKLRHSSFETVSDSFPERARRGSDFDSFENEQLLQTLPDEERVLFVLRYFEGYTSAEIGQMLSMPAGTVRTRLASARSRLRTALR